MSITGYVLIYLGALNGYLATHVETCTMGAADSLAGGIYTAALYGVGLILLWFGKRPRWALLALLPISWLLGSQAIFAVRLTVGYLMDGTSACATMFGPPWESDGREPFFSALWLGMYAVLIAGFIAIWWAGPRERHIPTV